ncbi:TRAP transporter small permease subunit [Litorimonas sp.]|uniref:TRAP transporter small permease subunit n=1 Tax=Litorimonas sp. TaxID=1892381 RepID=UPI003A8C3414
MTSGGIDVIGYALQFIGWAFFPVLLLPAFLLLTGLGKSLSRTIIVLIDTLSILIGEIIKWVMPLMVISVVIAVFALSIYGISSIWWDESVIYLHALGICLGVAPTYLAGEHVKVDIFFEKMDNRARALVEICGFYMLLAPVCIAVIWRSQSFVSFAWKSLEGSTNSGGIKGIYILKTALCVLFIMLLIQGFSVALRAGLKLRDSRQANMLRHTKIAFIPSFKTDGNS